MSTVTASAHYLRASFGLTDDVFNLVHAEVTAILRTLPLGRKDVLSARATATFTSTLLDDLLVQINSTFTDLFVYANSPHGSPLTASTSTETAEKLVLSAATKMQKFWGLCLVSDWLSASQASDLNIYEVLEDRLSHITAETVRAVIDCLLSSCRAETSEDLQGFSSYVPLCNFLRAVADSIKAASCPKAVTPTESSSAAGSNMVAEPPCAVPPQSDSDVANREDDSTGVPCDDDDEDDSESFTSLHVKFSPWKRLPSRKTLKTSADVIETSTGELQRPISTPAVFQGQDWKVDSRAQEELAEIFKRITSQPLALGASKLVSRILMNEASEIATVISSSVESCTSAASSAVVNLLIFKLQNYAEEVFKLADPSVKPALYTSLVKLVSEMILDSAKAKVREILVMNLLTMFQTITSIHDTADLNNSLQTGSKKLVKSVVQRVREALRDCVENGINWPVRRNFLRSVEDNLDPRCKKRSRLFNIKTPKLSFKKQKNKEDPKTVLSEMRMEENPVPTGPKPKKKNGVSAFFRGVWRRVSLTCISSGSNKIHPAD